MVNKLMKCKKRKNCQVSKEITSSCKKTFKQRIDQYIECQGKGFGRLLGTLEEWLLPHQFFHDTTRAISNPCLYNQT